MKSKILFIFAVFVVMLILGAKVYAQSTLISSSSGGGAGSVSFGTFDFGGAQSRQPPANIGAVPSIDNAIDTTDYIIGSGDMFFIAVVESPTIRHTATVDPSGRILINNIGSIDVGRMSYADARRAIIERVNSALRQPSEVYVTLVEAKNVTISVMGEVEHQGTYVLPGATRLVDAIRAANNNVLPNFGAADLRHVEVTNGQTVSVYDLLEYLLKGNVSQNPYIFPGDRMRILPVTRAVYIRGAISQPDTRALPLKEGETVRDILSMLTLNFMADTDSIILFNSRDNTRRVLSPSQHDYVLGNLDAITVPVRRDLQRVHTVFITGEVASPGYYHITEGTTSAKQLIDMAGGIKETGSSAQAVIIRPVRTLPERLGTGSAHMNQVRPERGASVTMASASLDYTIIRLVLYNSDKVMLEPGDRIVVPKRDNFVYISGAVKNPGAYPYVQGRSTSHYVSAAGGFASNADRSNVQVIMRYDDAVQIMEPRCVESGSVIIVPSSTQYKVLSTVVLPLITAAATTVGVTISIFQFRRGN